MGGNISSVAVVVAFLSFPALINGAACWLNLTEAQSAFDNGTIVEFCRPGQIRERGTDQCISLRSGTGEAMPNWSNCFSPFNCDRCYPFNNVQVDKECSPTQKQTCKCVDPTMILSSDGTRCTEPPSTSVPNNSSVLPSTSRGNSASPSPATQENACISNPCLSDPCKNDGVCLTEGSGFQCQCLSGWDGTLCEEHMTCRTKPCGSNGVCLPVGVSYVCNCSKGFAGYNCHQEYKENNVSFLEILFTTPETYVFITIALILGVIGGCLGMWRFLKRHKVNFNMQAIICKKTDDPLYAVAMNNLPHYIIKCGLVAIIYDEDRFYVKEDIDLAVGFANKCLGTKRGAACIKKIKVTTESSPQYVEAEMKKLSETRGYDLFLCIVLCHGDKEGIICGGRTKDPRYLNESKLIDMFKGDVCEAFRGKPKVYIFNHCRGVEIPKPVYAAGPGDADRRNERSISIDTDFLLVYSTMPLNISLISPEGSWSMMDLMKAVDTFPQYDLAHILTEMNRLVVLRQEKYRGKQAKQQPSYTNRLRMCIYLNGVQKETTEAVQATDEPPSVSGEDDDGDGNDNHNGNQESNPGSSAELVASHANAGGETSV